MMSEVVREDIENICRVSLPWNKLIKKSVLLTGATGFLGKYIILCLDKINELYGTDIVIYALGRNKKQFSDFIAKNTIASRLIFVCQDVCDEIDDAYKSDIIIHAASPANPYVIQNNPYEVYRANVCGFENLLKKARQWNTSDIVLFSSSAVYGHNSSGNGADESYRSEIDFTDIKDVYALSKQMTEMMGVCYEKEYGIGIKVLRPFVVYGPEDNLSSHKCMIDFLRNCIQDEDIIVKSDGTAVRSYIYITDAMTAFFYVLLKGQNTVYNISSVKNKCSISELAEIFSDYNQAINVEYLRDDSEYLKNKVAVMIGDNQKLKNLGWKEKVSLREGIYRIIRWAREEI